MRSTPADPLSPFVPTAFAVKVSGHGRAVLFLPGFACGGSVWDGTVLHLGDRYQSHVLTLAGVAGQPPGPSPSLASVRDQLAQYVTHHRLERPVLVGHSLGGTIALWVGATVPGIGGIVDVDGTAFLPGLDDPSMTRARAEPIAEARSAHLAALPPEGLLPFVRQMMSHMFSAPEDLERVAAEAARSDVATLAAFFREGYALDLRADLARITAPVTLIAATPGTNREERQAQWRAHLDGIARLETVFVETKHFVMLEQPERFHALLDEALARAK